MPQDSTTLRAIWRRRYLGIIVVLCLLAVAGCSGSSDSFTYVDPNPAVPAGTSPAVRTPLVTFGSDTVHDAVVLAQLNAYVTAVPIVTADGQTAAAADWLDDIAEHELRYVRGAVAIAAPAQLTSLDASFAALDQAVKRARTHPDRASSQAQITKASRQLVVRIQRANVAIVPPNAREDDAFRAAIIDGTLSEMIIIDQVSAEVPTTSDYLRIWSTVTAAQTTLLQHLAESARSSIRTKLDRIATTDTPGPEAPSSFAANQIAEQLSEIVDSNAAAARIDVAPPGPAANAAGALQLMNTAVQNVAAETLATNDQSTIAAAMTTARKQLAVVAPSIVTLDPDLLTRLRLLLGKDLPASIAANTTPYTPDTNTNRVVTDIAAAADDATSAIEQELQLRRMADEAT